MEEDMIISAHINSVDMNKVLPTSLAYFNKKRKFQAEQLGIPLPKHLCSYQSYAGCSSSPTGTEAKESLAFMIKAENNRRGQDDDSEPESEKDSNSFIEDADSVTSGEAKIYPGCLKSCSSDQASTSSLNWGANWSKNALYSLESRSVTKLAADRPEQPPTGAEWDTLHHGSGCHPSLDYESHLLEFGNHGDCTCSECGNEGIEMSPEKELDDLLYSNGVKPNNYVLSSGRWTANQVADACSVKTYVARTLQKCLWVRVGSSRSSVFLEDPTQVRQHFGEFAQHRSKMEKLRAQLHASCRSMYIDSEPGPKKLTIDKEFEQYFSMLML